MDTEQDDKETAFFFQLKHLPVREQIEKVRALMLVRPAVVETRRFLDWGISDELINFIRSKK